VACKKCQTVSTASSSTTLPIAMTSISG
jgi:hypothetical protein